MSTYTITALSESPAGFSVSVCVTGDAANENAQFLISRELWLWGRLSAGTALSEEQFLDMEHSASFSRALARMRSILSYSGQSRANLINRLRQYGFDDAICEETADYAVEHGLVREEAQAEHAADVYLRRKYWGKRRIRAELAARGYSEEVISQALAVIPEEEFRRALRRIIEQKYGRPPRDPEERQKMVLSLLRLGYTGSEIKDAIAEF